MPKITMTNDWRGHKAGDTFEATFAQMESLARQKVAFTTEPIPGEEEEHAAVLEASEAIAKLEAANAKAEKARVLRKREKLAPKKAPKPVDVDPSAGLFAKPEKKPKTETEKSDSK